MIQVQWRLEWRIISYQQYRYNDNLSEWLPVINNTTNMSEGLPVINDTSAIIICVINDLCDCLFNQQYKYKYDLCSCFLNQRRVKPCYPTLVVTPLIQTLKIRSPTYLTEAWIQAFKKRLFTDQRLSNLVVVEGEGIYMLYKGKPLKEPQIKW